jgi:hypothetical protein
VLNWSTEKELYLKIKDSAHKENKSYKIISRLESIMNGNNKINWAPVHDENRTELTTVLVFWRNQLRLIHSKRLHNIPIIRSL